MKRRLAQQGLHQLAGELLCEDFKVQVQGICRAGIYSSACSNQGAPTDGRDAVCCNKLILPSPLSGPLPMIRCL